MFATPYWAQKFRELYSQLSLKLGVAKSTYSKLLEKYFVIWSNFKPINFEDFNKSSSVAGPKKLLTTH